MQTQNNLKIIDYSKAFTRKALLMIACMLITLYASGQEGNHNSDTVIINFGDSSKAIFQIKNQDDLNTLKLYDLNQLIRDIAEKMDSTNRQTENFQIENSPEEYLLNPPADMTQHNENEENLKGEEGSKTKKDSRTRNFFNADIGTNNFFENGRFPNENNALYAVRPWGSWYVGLNSTNRTHISKKFALDWGAGVSWYNFKFENDKTRIEKTDDGLNFFEDPNDFNFKRSKLTVAYVNASMVPMLILGKWDKDKKTNSGFRIGLGGYGGYRIASYSKYVYRENGDKEKDKDKNSFFLNNFRYGLRLQLGFGDMDFFANYDLNELFTDNKGPELNAFSFGLTF